MYVQMTEEDLTRKAPTVLTIGEDDTAHALVRNSFRDFESEFCDCYNQSDKARIFAVIARYPDGVTEFNRHVKIIASNLFGEARMKSKALRHVAPCHVFAL